MKLSYALSKIALFFVCLSLCALSGCDNGRDNVHGSWRSVSVQNPSPFFKNVLTEYKEGSVTLVLAPDKKFVWTDSLQKMQLKGTYLLKAREIYLTLDKDDEVIRIWYAMRKEKLVIKTDDYFTFTFVRDTRQ